MSDKKITVLVVEPMKETYTKEICGLGEMQELVGGNMKTVSLSNAEPVIAVLNEKGGLMGLPYNRELTSDDDSLYLVISGTFLVVGTDGESIVSLTPEQIARYKEKYDSDYIVTARPPQRPKRKKENKRDER